MLRRRDVACAIVLSVVSFAVYAGTLAPGLIGITDSPKFQLVGRVLGTAHPPGYPLYVLVSHLFSYLPVGSLAYRINLMSAFFSAGACALTFLCARAIGAGIPVAAASALGLAFGSTFWYVSTIAEVYALNAFLVAAIILTLLAWRRSQRPATFFAAVALVGLAAGNHTTVVFMVPAVALFACAVAPRFALHPRTIVLSALIVIAALTQYLLIALRSSQALPGDAQFWSFSHLLEVMAGRQYFGDILPGGIPQLFARLPAIRDSFFRELSIAGAVFAATGVIVSVWRQPPALLLLATALVGYAGFTTSYMPHEFEVFLIPGFIISWIFAAAGAQWIVDVIGRRTRPWLAALASALLLVLPTRELAQNYEARDLSYAWEDVRFFDALFDQLPEGAVLLHDNFLIDRMIYYKTLGERAGEKRHVTAPVPADLERITRAWRDGHQVFAFPETATMLRLLDGAEFSYTPFPLSNGSIEQYLADLPRGTLVAVGVPGVHVNRFASDGRLPLSSIGFNKTLSGPEVDGIAVIGLRGATNLNGLAFPITAPRQVVTTYQGARISAPIVVRAEGEAAAILFGGREIIRSGAGMVVAVWNRSGLVTAFVVPSSSLRTPTLPTTYGVYPLRTLRERLPITGAPADLMASLRSGQFVYSPSPGPTRLLIYAGRERPLAPALQESSARDWPALDVRHFDSSQSAQAELRESIERDGLIPTASLVSARHVYRLSLETSWAVRSGVHVGLGSPPDVAVGRLASGEGGTIHALDLMSGLKRVDDDTRLIQMARDYQEQLVGAGWSPVQSDDIAAYRETIEPEAEITLPIPDPAALRIGIQLLQLPDDNQNPAAVQLEFNGRRLQAITPVREWKRYWWDIDAGVTSAGANSLVVICPSGHRIAVSDVLIETRR